MSEQLPALIDRASRRLTEARSSAELLEARSAAQAALHYAKITQAANDTQADCLRMIVRAEMRMADEVDRAQAEGAIAKKNETYVRGSDISSLDEVGISRQRLAEWREIRDAGEDVVNETIQAALEEGRAPTKTEILNAAKGRPFVTNNTGNNEWYTPQEYIDAAREVMGGIDLDPASCETANRIVRADKFYTQEDDGLTKDWTGRVWMNPPYGANLIHKFTQKICESKVEQACVLVNNATETGWFQELLASCSAVCFVRGRIRFIDTDGVAANAPLQGQAIFYFGANKDRFLSAFSAFGHVMQEASYDAAF